MERLRMRTTIFYSTHILDDVQRVSDTVVILNRGARGAGANRRDVGLGPNHGPVLGISLVLAWGGPMPFLSAPIQKYAPWLYDVMPWKLLVDFENNHQLAYYVANGQPLPTVAPLVATALWCVLFIAVALWRMSREEF